MHYINKMDIVAALEKRILVLDGAMGTMIQNSQLEEADCRGDRFMDHPCALKGNNDLLSITKPEIIKTIHKEYLKAGFGVVNTHSQDGIMRGSGMLVSLNPNSNNAYRILDDNSGQYLSFSKSVKSRQSYPTSRMGAMALLRQTYLDATWYANGKMKNKDLSLDALNKNKNETQIFETGNHIDAVRADKVGDEFGIQYTIVGSGDEFERIHVASFNAKEDEKYNQGNCEIARELFQKQDGVKTKFWCEKGVFRK